MNIDFVPRCDHIVHRWCCPHDEEDHIKDPVDGDFCEACMFMEEWEDDGAPTVPEHTYRAEERCGRVEHPPMVPAWDHKRWTGHAYKAGMRAVEA